jgi:hypothetical protein
MNKKLSNGSMLMGLLAGVAFLAPRLAGADACDDYNDQLEICDMDYWQCDDPSTLDDLLAECQAENAAPPPPNNNENNAGMQCPTNYIPDGKGNCMPANSSATPPPGQPVQDCYYNAQKSYSYVGPHGGTCTCEAYDCEITKNTVYPDCTGDCPT